MRVLRQWLERSLWDVVPRDHHESPQGLRRRQWRHRRLPPARRSGARALLADRARQPAASTLPALGLAAVWTIGAFASGPLHLGSIERRDMHVRPIAPTDRARPRPGARLRARCPDRAADRPAGAPGQQHPRLRRPGLAGDPGGGHRDQRHRRGAVLPRSGLRRHHAAIRCCGPRSPTPWRRGHGQHHAELRRHLRSACSSACSGAPPAASWRRSSRTSRGRSPCSSPSRSSSPERSMSRRAYFAAGYLAAGDSSSACFTASA